MRLLLLEDDPELGQLHMELAQDLGFQVTWAKDGVEGLKRALTQGFDIIITDNRMPRMDGREFAGLAKRFGVEAPILACTSDDGDQEVREQFYQSGVVKVYGKFKFRDALKDSKVAA